MLHSMLLLLFSLRFTLSENEKKPNIVLILTDDQDVVMDGMSPLKNVKTLLQNEGVTFENSYTTSPICCPSRASILSGKYSHNHRTVNNTVSGGCGGRFWQSQEFVTFATLLQDAGYNTFYAGKYLNTYGLHTTGGPERVPPGWKEWHGLVGNSVYYNYTLSNDGLPSYSSDAYLTQMLQSMATKFIQNQTEEVPFLMVVAPPAPHSPFTPAPEDQGAYENATLVKHENFNTGFENKHWLVGMPPAPLPPHMETELTRVFQARWETLLSVDRMVLDVIDTLTNNSLLEDTYVIFTSDNGYHIGQFSQPYDKRQPYESDIKVPLIIKGPGIAKNTTSYQPILNIDLAPTIISLAGLKPPDRMDGKPINFTRHQLEERYMLIDYQGMGSEHHVDSECPWKYDGPNLDQCYPSFGCKCQDSRNNTYNCIRHFAININLKYCTFDDHKHFEEMYNLTVDPYELDNVNEQVPPSFRNWYQMILRQMLACKGAEQCSKTLFIDADSTNHNSVLYYF